MHNAVKQSFAKMSGLIGANETATADAQEIITHITADAA